MPSSKWEAVQSLLPVFEAGIGADEQRSEFRRVLLDYLDDAVYDECFHFFGEDGEFEDILQQMRDETQILAFSGRELHPALEPETSLFGEIWVAIENWRNPAQPFQNGKPILASWLYSTIENLIRQAFRNLGLFEKKDRPRVYRLNTIPLRWALVGTTYRGDRYIVILAGCREGSASFVAIRPALGGVDPADPEGEDRLRALPACRLDESAATTIPENYEDEEQFWQHTSIGEIIFTESDAAIISRMCSERTAIPPITLFAYSAAQARLISSTWRDGYAQTTDPYELMLEIRRREQIRRTGPPLPDPPPEAFVHRYQSDDEEDERENRFWRSLTEPQRGLWNYVVDYNLLNNGAKPRNKEIAVDLGLSLSTVASMKSRILRKWKDSLADAEEELT